MNRIVACSLLVFPTLVFANGSAQAGTSAQKTVDRLYSQVVKAEGLERPDQLLGLITATLKKPKVMAEVRNQAAMGSPHAEDVLGNAYARAWGGVPQDYAQAASWYRKAADQGDADAQAKLGSLYYTGHGVPQDYAQAASWIRKAADQGDADAQAKLAALYLTGHGVPQDYAQAASWTRKAADQGYANAQFNLGLDYANGQGVPQNYAQAASWYRKAADQGVASAQTNLGALYANGHGVPQDYVAAYALFNLAAAQGDSQASSNRNIVAGRMSRRAISEAQDLSRRMQTEGVTKALDAYMRSPAAR